MGRAKGSAYEEVPTTSMYALIKSTILDHKNSMRIFSDTGEALEKGYPGIQGRLHTSKAGGEASTEGTSWNFSTKII